MISSPITSVDCQKQVRSWRYLRSLMELLIPRCNCIFIEEENYEKKPIPYYKHHSAATTTTTTITGTIFGSPKGKVSFCIQTNPKSTNPILLLELAVSTTTLAREMRKGIVRIALESSTNMVYEYSSSSSSTSLLSMPIWTMYYNGKRVGFAVKRKPTKADLEVLRKLESKNVGAGTIHYGKEVIITKREDNDIMYLRGKIERVNGSHDSESFHLVDQEENMDQELSIFFLRSLN